MSITIPILLCCTFYSTILLFILSRVIVVINSWSYAIIIFDCMVILPSIMLNAFRHPLYSKLCQHNSWSLITGKNQKYVSPVVQSSECIYAPMASSEKPSWINCLVFILGLFYGMGGGLPPKISDSPPKILSNLVTATLIEPLIFFNKNSLRFYLRASNNYANFFTLITNSALIIVVMTFVFFFCSSTQVGLDMSV